MFRDLQIFLLLHIIALIPVRVAGQCQGMRELNMSLPETANLNCGHVCLREHGWKMLPVLWAPLEVNINCSSSSFTVVTGHDHQQLVSKASPIKWCGWHQILKDPRVCQFTLSPLQDQYLAVKPTSNGGFLPGRTAFTCVLNSSRELSSTAMCLTVVGTLLFFYAERLTMNEYFRLTSGSLMFMSGAVLVLAFMFVRSVPQKRSLAAAFTISGTSVLAVVRWFYGTWLPDAHTLLLSRPFIVYMSVTAVLGWGVTYWFDDTANVKLNRIIRAMLQLVGLLMVYLGISDERVAVGATVVLFSSRGLWAVGRRLCYVLWLSARAIRSVLWLLLSSCRRVANSRLHRRPRSPKTAPTAKWQPAPAIPEGETAAHVSTEISSEHDEDEEEQLLSDEELQAAVQHSDRTTGLPAAEADAVASGSARSPLHCKEPPPPSPFVATQHRATSFGGWLDAAPARVVSEEGYRFPSSTSPAAARTAANLPAEWLPSSVAAATAHKSPWSQDGGAVNINGRQPLGSPTGTTPTKSPWSSEKVAYDVNMRRQLSPHRGVAGGGASPGVQPQQQQQEIEQPHQDGAVSPLVASGKIINPESGRAILINQTTYNKLLSQGYVPDLHNGVLVAPAAAGAVQAETISGPVGTSGVSAARNARQRHIGAVTTR